MNLIDKATKGLEAASSRFWFDPLCIEQGTSEWLIMRLGVLSASNADKILAGTQTAGRRTYMASLIKQVVTCLTDEELPFRQLEHGKMQEPVGRDALSLSMGVDIQEVPFIYKDATMRAGASPDGVFDNVGVELKCPFDSTVFIKFACFDDVKKEYEKQCQFQNWVMGSEKVIFANYDERMQLINKLHYIEFERDEKMMKKFDDAVPQFIHDMDKALDKFGVNFGDHWEFLKSKEESKL